MNVLSGFLEVKKKTNMEFKNKISVSIPFTKSSKTHSIFKYFHYNIQLIFLKVMHDELYSNFLFLIY